MSALGDMLRPIRASIRGMIARAVLSRVVETTQARTVQVEILAGEVRDAVEHLEPYGFTGRPRAGAEAIVVHLAGDRSLPVVLVIPDRRYRPLDLAEGEVCLHDDQGQRVVIRRTEIDVEANTVAVGNGAILAAARTTDATVVDGTTDAKLVAWMALVDTAISGLAAALVEPVCTAVGTAYTTGVGLLVPPGVPDSATGKITGGSSDVTIR